MRKIIFRADGNHSIGMGHFVRSLALANMLKDDFHCIFALQNPSEYQIGEIKNVCKEYISLPSDESHFEIFLNILNGNEIVVLDNYYYDTEYQRKIKKKGCKLVCIDDMHDKHYVANIVINHAPKITADVFSCEPYTQLCLGLQYALLRHPFLHAKKKTVKKIENVFICFGGSDVHDITFKSLQSAVRIANLKKINVVTGQAYKNKEQLQRFSKQFPSVHLHEKLTDDELCRVMQDSHLAIVPASTVLWEAMAVGLPCIYGYYAENQTDICRNIGSDKEKSLSCVGNYNALTVEKLEAAIQDVMKKHSPSNSFPIDDQVPNRFQEIFKNDIAIRRTNLNDLQLYFEWANDPDVRKNSFNTAQIALKDHTKWFYKKLSSPDTFMYICYYKEQALGQIRFDAEPDHAIVDISINKIFRGQGLGDKALLKAVTTFVDNTNFQKIKAFVKSENIASKRIFEKAGFKQDEFNKELDAFSFIYLKK